MLAIPDYTYPMVNFSQADFGHFAIGGPGFGDGSDTALLENSTNVTTDRYFFQASFYIMSLFYIEEVNPSYTTALVFEPQLNGLGYSILTYTAVEFTTVLS